MLPIPAPTALPTPKPSFSCYTGTSLYSVRLFDSGGDGWQGATWTVYDPSLTYAFMGGTLADGYQERVYQCVPDACGWLVVGGGAADSEITWQFDSYTGSSFQGVAPVTDYFCLVGGYVASVPSPAPTISSLPTALPTAAPSQLPSAAPTSLPTPPPYTCGSPGSTASVSLDSETEFTCNGQTLEVELLSVIYGSFSFSGTGQTGFTTVSLPNLQFVSGNLYISNT